jgi:hypothetical protein
LISNLAEFKQVRQQNGPYGPHVTSITEPLDSRRTVLIKELVNHARLAPLATADKVWQALEAAIPGISGANIDFASPDCVGQIGKTIVALTDLLNTFQVSGREELWGISEPKPKPRAPSS